MVYTIKFKPAAARKLLKFPKPIQVKLARKIDSLTINPYPQGTKKLKGSDDLHRLRVGDYRIIYQVKNDQLLILVVKIGHRKEIYRSSK